VDQPVEDGVRQSGVGDAAVPFGHRDLSDDDSGAAAVAVIQDFQQVSGLGAREGVSEPVIADEQRGAGQRPQQLGIGAVGMGQFERLKQARGALVAHVVTGLAGRPAEGTSQKRFDSAMFLPP
jgi:hypothetical protein